MENFLLENKSMIWCGHMGHKNKCPTEDQINIFIKIIEDAKPMYWCLVREDPDEAPQFTHLHYVIIKPTEKTMDQFRKQVLKEIPTMKREGQGGETPFTLSLGSKIEKKYKVDILDNDEKVIFKICYQVKFLSESDYRYDNRDNLNFYKQMEEKYWKLNAKILKAQSQLKQKQGKKTESIQNRIKIFFEKKTDYMKSFGLVSQSPDLSMIVEVLALFYQTEGADLPHTAETVERYALWILANVNPSIHKSALLRKICNKYKFNEF